MIPFKFLDSCSSLEVCIAAGKTTTVSTAWQEFQLVINNCYITLTPR